MKTIIRNIVPSLLTLTTLVAEDSPEYTNFLRQVQLPSGVAMDFTRSEMAASEPSPLGVTSGGARFEIFSVHNTTHVAYKLATANVAAQMPTASIVIDTEDPYGKKLPEYPVVPGVPKIPVTTFANPEFECATVEDRAKYLPVNDPALTRRTRADRPFKVYVKTANINDGPGVAECYKRVDFRRHLLSYGTNLTGEGVDRSLAILDSPALPQFLTNQIQVASKFDINKIPVTPDAGRATIRGEEVFSVWTLNDARVPSKVVEPKMIASQRLQIWPVSSASMSGISMDQKTRFAIPTVTFRYTDTYPLSNTYAQVYKGEKRDGVKGETVGGSSRVNTSAYPESSLQTSSVDFDSLFTSDGRWTMEVLTVSEIDTMRLAYVTFTVDRSIEVNGTFTTIE